MNLQIVLNSQKKSLLIKPPQKILAKFSYPKKSQNQKFQTQKKSVNYPCYLKSSAPPLPSRAAEYLVKRILQGFWISHPQEIA